MTDARRFKLTKAAIEQRCAPTGERRQVIYWDTELRGFGLRVGPSASSFIVQRDLPGGRTRRMTIGRWPTWNVDDARREARSLIVRMDKGEDPAATKRAARARGVTVQEALDMHLARLRARDASPRTVETLTVEMARYLSDWLPRPLAEITREECRRRHQRLTEHNGPVAANRALRHFRAIFNTAARVHDLPGRAPTVGVDFNRQRRRREPIPPADLPAWHAKVQQLTPIMRDLHLFILLTGLRRADAVTARWEHVSFEHGTIHRPKPKGGVDRAFTVPLIARCLEIVKARREENAVLFDARGGDGGWIFPSVVTRGGRRVTTHVQEPKVCRVVNGKHVQLLPSVHRLRDTFASAAHAARVPMLDLKLLMNHTLPAGGGDVTEGYIRPDIEGLRASTEAVTAWLLGRIGTSK